MSRYLVTGVAGFIGSSIARALVARGESVRGLDNLSTGKRENLVGLEAIEFIEADLNDDGVAARSCAGVDYIFHEAAIPSVPRSVKNPIESNHANVTATLALLVAARNAGVKRIIYAGSSSAYGSNPTLPKREDMLPEPISPYAVSKLAGEYYMQSFTKVYGLETVTIRYFNVFGPYQDPTSQYSGVMAKFTRMMLEGERPTINGDGEQSRDFTYIDNVVQANLLAASAPAEKVSGRVFNVATGSRITVNQVYKELQTVTGFTVEAAHGPDQPGDVKHSLADITAAREALGYEPLVSFEDGLRKTVEWYKKSLRVGAR
jgi:nucleoside-diphosphate-sugar epimerase